MEFYEAVNARRTIRDFTDTSIDDATIEKIIAAGMKAPTNDHMRDWHFVVITDKTVVHELISKIPKKFSASRVNAILDNWGLEDKCQRDLYLDAIPKQYRMLEEASCVIVPLFRQKADLMKPKCLSDLNGFASIWCCIENMFLSAAAENYACALRIPLGNEDDWTRKVLGYPEEYLMPCFIAVGKPAEGANCIIQKEYALSERIHKNAW